MGKALVALVLVVAGLGAVLVPAGAQQQNPRVALLIGDSFTAGTGAGNFYGAANCYRSSTNWGERYADKAAAAEGVAVKVTNRACHGAITEHFDRRYKRVVWAWDEDFFVGSPAEKRERCASAADDLRRRGKLQVDELLVWNENPPADALMRPNLLVCDKYVRPQKLSVRDIHSQVNFTFGGNDIGFGAIVVQCLVGLTDNAARCAELVDRARARLPKVFDTIDTIVDEVVRRAPHANVSVVGYPNLEVDPDYSVSGFRVGAAIAELVQLANAGGVSRFGSCPTGPTFQAGGAGWTRYVPVSERFAGHEPNAAGSRPPWASPDVWLNQIAVTGGQGQSYHPNPAGHEQIARELASADSCGDSPNPFGTPAQVTSHWWYHSALAISPNGRYLAYSKHLVEGDVPWQFDYREVIRLDRITGMSSTVSVNSSGVPAEGYSDPWAVSDDGSVLFSSSDTSTLDGQWPRPSPDSSLYLRDVDAGTTTLVVAPPDPQPLASISRGTLSSDGDKVFFVVASDAWGDGDPIDAVYEWNRSTGTTTSVGLTSSTSGALAVSPNGRYLAYEEARGVADPGGPPGGSSIYVLDRVTGARTSESVAFDGGPSDGSGTPLTITDDGRWVLFRSTAGDLVPGDTSNTEDLFVRDRATGTNTRVTRPVDRLDGFGSADMSQDGRWVTYSTGTETSPIPNPGFPFRVKDVYAWDRATATRSVVSQGLPVGPAPQARDSYLPRISRDGGVIAFASQTFTLGDPDGPRSGALYTAARNPGLG